MKAYISTWVVLLVVLGGPGLCEEVPSTSDPAASVDNLLRAPLDIWPEGEVLVSHFRLPPGRQGERHHHPGEGFLFVIEGSLEVRFEDGETLRAEAGELLRIPMDSSHHTTAGAKGVRGVVFRVHPKGQPERHRAE